MKLLLKSHSSVWMATVILLMTFGCKSKESPAPQAIIVDAKTIEFTSLVPGIIQLNAVGINFMWNGVERSANITPLLYASDSNGSDAFANTDIIGVTPTMITITINNVSASAKNLTMPNSVEITLTDNKEFTKITAQITPNTQFYLSGQTVFSAYNASQLRTNTQGIANQLPTKYLSVGIR